MFPKNLLKEFVVISMKDVDDPPELNIQINNSIKLLRNNNINVIEVVVDGDNLFCRVIRLIAIAD